MTLRSFFAFAGLIGIAGGAISVVASCSSVANPQCECVDPTLSVTVPPESASAVKEVQLSGAACDGVKATCVQDGIGGCASWRFEAIAAGTCHIDMFFQAGTTFSRDITIKQTTGCCAGLYPDPENAGAIEVTPPGGAASDAGTNDSAASGDEDAAADSGSDG